MTTVETASAMLRDPLCQRFIQRARATGDNRIYTAEDVLGERLMRMGALILSEHQDPGSVITPLRPNTDKLGTILMTATLAISATPHLWTEEVRNSIRDLKIPRHVVSPRVLQQPRSWHTFETGIGLGGNLKYHGRGYEGHTADACLICDSGEGLEVLMFGEMADIETGDLRPTVSGGLLRYGLVYPDDFSDEMANLAESTLTLLAFLNSPYIPKEQRRPSRAARREAKRLGSPVDDDLVTFVVLRRANGKPHKNEESESILWRHRWIVNGHLRAQWYPSENAHHLIWIAPYLKGPEDAPMLNHAYKVAR